MMFFSAYSHQLKKLLGWCHRWLGITYIRKRLRKGYARFSEAQQKVIHEKVTKK